MSYNDLVIVHYVVLLYSAHAPQNPADACLSIACKTAPCATSIQETEPDMLPIVGRTKKTPARAHGRRSTVPCSVDFQLEVGLQAQPRWG